MISAAVLRSMLRRWYVIVVGLALAGMCFVLFIRASAVYESVTTVVFISPGDSTVTGVDLRRTDSLVAFAALIAQQMNDGHPVPPMGTADATIFGAGQRDGTQVALPNYGSQWQLSYPDPQLSVQVVGPTSDGVENTRFQLLNRIQQLTQNDQRKQEVPPVDWITASTVSVAPPQYVGATSSMRARGLLALLFVGFCVSAWAAVFLDRRILGREGGKAMALRNRIPFRLASHHHFASHQPTGHTPVPHRTTQIRSQRGPSS